MKVSGKEDVVTIQAERGYLAFIKSKEKVEVLVKPFNLDCKKFAETTYRSVSPCNFFRHGSSLAKSDKVICLFERRSAK